MASVAPGEEDEEIISGINVTPLVDVFLVLLILFLVTATYIVKESIEVDLPRVAHAGEATGATLTVVLTRDGELFLDGARRSEDGVRADVRAALARDRDARAVISADERASHGAVVRVIDLLRGEGISRFALHVERAR